MLVFVPLYHIYGIMLKGTASMSCVTMLLMERFEPESSTGLVRCAQVVGRENVIAGTDCGFGTFLGTSVVAPSVAWDKLQSLAEGAQLVSQELW
jgi:hypothetical protein